MNDDLTVFAEKGMVYGSNTPVPLSKIAWEENKSFKGVFMKTLVSGSETGGNLSCHLVRIEAGKEIGRHIHAGKMEIHEVIGGSGIAYRGDTEMDYRKGTLSLIPADVEHRVTAGNDGLFLFAKFSPALQ